MGAESPPRPAVPGPSPDRPPIGRFWRRWRGSLRARIASAVVALVAVALLIGGMALVIGLRAALTGEARDAATVRAAEVARVVEAGGDPLLSVRGDDDVLIQVRDETGRVVAASPAGAAGLALGGVRPGQPRTVEVPFDEDPFAVAAATTHCGRRMVVLGRSLDAVTESTRALTGLLALGLPVLLLVVAVTAWHAVGRALGPVEAVRAEVDRISAADLHRRVRHVEAADEIARLATTMNRMLDRLERARRREQRFIADASHELRTPIATIRQHAEVALAHPGLSAGLADTARAESLRMQALVDDLLLLARADEHVLPFQETAVDLDDLVFVEAHRLRQAGTASVDTSAVTAARVEGDPAALGRVLRNLADNAARHARSRVGFHLAERDGSAELHVDDDGPGIPTADRARVFERFVRLDHARARTDGGAGLGLAIVAEIVRVHGGTTEAVEAPIGGARLTVRLPLAP
jgi:signal transduction histidine kinase